MTPMLFTLLPLLLFLIAAVCLSLYVRSRTSREAGGLHEEGEAHKSTASEFIRNYFIGNRGLGGFVLAMTTVATYGSVSSFVGGPGQAWEIGFGWVYMAVVQVTALILLYGVFGKKMALVSRKLNAVTIVDVIRARYGSNALANLSAVVIVIFFIATMVAQFVGGAKLFEAVTGYPYFIGLAIFGVTAIIFTVIGGFRGVAVTDALCGIMMIVGIIALAYGIFSVGGGYESIMQQIANTEPQKLDPFSNGDMPVSLYFTQWLLVGVFTLVLPQSVVRTLSFKDTKSLHNAMIIGTIVIGLMMIGTTGLGVLASGVLTDDLTAYGNSVDNIIPLTIVQSLPPLLAGIAIVGPIAASISTVSSLLISSASAIINDMYLQWAQPRNKKASLRGVAIASQLSTLIIGAIVFVLSIVPPDVIWKINMFAFGGLETAFFFVLVCGMFWKRANAVGAICSMAGGVAAYCVTMALGFKIAGMHQIVIGIAVAGVLMLIGTVAAHHHPNSKLEVFFPE